MDIEVARDDLAQVRALQGVAHELDRGEARVRIDRFALSSNNISYAVYGNVFGYWDFFPSVPDDDPGATAWGRIPVWGFGEVIETSSLDLAVGERLFGYYPMSSEVVLRPGKGDERGCFDVSPHRAAMASAYSQYLRSAADPLYRADREDHQMLLYPLFYTSFLADDLLVDNRDFGADVIVVSSASSKTAIAMAFLAHRRGTHVVGVTSSTNLGFVAELGVYDEVLDYDAVDQLPLRPSVYVDVAGNRDVLHAVHSRLSGALAYSMTVGGTHWNHQADPSRILPGPAPEFFFAPTQIAKRTADWGRDELEARLLDAWEPFVTWTDEWIDFRHVTGPDAVTEVYRTLLRGEPDPKVGYICSLRDTH